VPWIGRGVGDHQIVDVHRDVPVRASPAMLFRDAADGRGGPRERVEGRAY
jgi:hypothetical protein